MFGQQSNGYTIIRLDEHEHVEGVVGYDFGSLYIILGEYHRSMDKVWEGAQGGIERRSVKLQLFSRFARDERGLSKKDGLNYCGKEQFVIFFHKNNRAGTRPAPKFLWYKIFDLPILQGAGIGVEVYAHLNHLCTC